MHVYVYVNVCMWQEKLALVSGQFLLRYCSPRSARLEGTDSRNGPWTLNLKACILVSHTHRILKRVPTRLTIGKCIFKCVYLYMVCIQQEKLAGTEISDNKARYVNVYLNLIFIHGRRN